MRYLRHKEAAKEASSLLEVAPNATGALKSRARAYEALGLFKQALSDVVAVNRGDAATQETREMERRLKDAVAGRRERPASAPSAAAAPSRPLNPNSPITVKASLGSETKILHVGIAVTYAELLDQVHSKFPGSGRHYLLALHCTS
jgi:hypothetical protein